MSVQISESSDAYRALSRALSQLKVPVPTVNQNVTLQVGGDSITVTITS